MIMDGLFCSKKGRLNFLLRLKHASIRFRLLLSNFGFCGCLLRFGFFSFNAFFLSQILVDLVYQFLRTLVGQRTDLEEARGFHIELEAVVRFGVVPADGF